MNKNTSSKNDSAARAAWMYYIYGMNQDVIATTMGISRQRVQRLISLALKENLVNFTINHSIIECQKLTIKLKNKFDLSVVEVAPSVSEISENLEGVSNLAAKIMDTYFLTKKSLNLIFGSGRTLAHVTEKLSPIQCLQHNVVSNIGNHTPDGSEPEYFVLGRISQNVKSNFYPFPAPIIASSKKIRDFFSSYYPIKSVIKLINNFDVCFVSVGCIANKNNTPLLIDKIISEKQFLNLKKLGAVGEINGLCFDINGKIIQTPSDYIPTTCLPSTSKNNPVIAVSTGSHKAKAVRAAIKAKLINGLITDESTAKKILS